MKTKSLILSILFITVVLTLPAFAQPLDFGDAPEGAPAYPGGAIGAFPTCKTVLIATWIQHMNFGAYFGQLVDFEPEGNGGLCPSFSPYDNDECFNDGDAGLIRPSSYTIVLPPPLQVQLCPNATSPSSLGAVCQPALWGPNVDILVHNTMPGHEPYLPAYVNVLMDWDQNGMWGGSSTCPDGTPVPEHVLQNFLVPPLYIGPLSALQPPGFLIGPNPGYVWTRFTISEHPVPQDWNGAEGFEDGESEDYLLRILDQEGEPTVFPEEPTHCPVVRTECPEIATQCPEEPVTECPVIATQCQDPIEITQCPIVPTKCPLSDTACPVEETRCPKIPGQCPPQEWTIWPQGETLCPGVPTVCPMIPTECQQGAPPTMCDFPYTTCPLNPTSCPSGPEPTLCPSQPTQCPMDPTWCEIEPTECPLGPVFTQCPLNPTLCPPIATECAMNLTQCPVIDTVCPIGPTDTECPVIATECPETPTVCVQNPVPTECPVDPGYCPPYVPDLCDKFWDRYLYCLALEAADRNVDYSACRALPNQPACETAECYWNPTGLPSPGACIVDICLSNANFDGAVDGKDLAVYKKELFRVDCP